MSALGMRNVSYVQIIHACGVVAVILAMVGLCT